MNILIPDVMGQLNVVMGVMSMAAITHVPQATISVGQQMAVYTTASAVMATRTVMMHQMRPTRVLRPLLTPAMATSAMEQNVC